MANKHKIQVGLWLTLEVKEQVREAAYLRRLNQSDLIEQAIVQFLKNGKPAEPPTKKVMDKTISTEFEW